MINNPYCRRNFGSQVAGSVHSALPPGWEINRQLSNGYELESADLSDAIYKRLWSRVYSLENSFVSIEETTRLLPALSVTAPQIKAPDPILLNSRELDGFSVMLAIVSYYYPASGSDVGHPHVILRIHREVILVILHFGWKSQDIQGLGKSYPNVAVKEQCGGACARYSSV